MVAGDKRRSAENLEIKPLGYLSNLCQPAKHTRDSCLFAFLYLSGRRLREVLHIKKGDLVFSQGFMSFETFNEKCFRSKPQSNYSINMGDRYYEKINVGFSTTSEAYKQLGSFVSEHIKDLKNEDYLFPNLYRNERHIGYSQAYKAIITLCPEIWPHWLRHQRFSAITEQLKDLPTADLIYSLKDFTKHHRTDSTLAYIHRMRNIEIRKTI